MKKILLSLVIIIGYQSAFSQSYLNSVALKAKGMDVLLEQSNSGFSKGENVVEYAVSNTTGFESFSLSTFSAKRKKKAVELSWDIASADKTVYILQRQLTNGWENLAYIPASAPSDPTFTLSSYTYSDVNTFKGLSLYRIQEVSDSGHVRLSNVVTVKGAGDNSSLMVYPIPSYSGKINMVFNTEDTRDIKIFDMRGQLIKEVNNVTATNMELTRLRQGTFSLQARERCTGAIAVQKIVIK